MKEDLRNGDVILRRDETAEIAIVDLNVLITKGGGCRSLSYINNDLTSSTHKDGDIISVRRPRIGAQCRIDAFEKEYGTLVYIRKEPEEMTLEEICKELGREIKIVRGK